MMPVRDEGTEAPLSPLERALHVFTDVRAGEGLTAVVMFANVFLILCAYYFVKPLRDGWIAVSGVTGLSSVEVKAYTSFAQGLVLIGAVALYARLVTRWPRRELITRTTLFCMFNLLVFWVLHETQVPGVGVVFYIWVGMFGLFVVAQFWAFAADLYSDERGRRLLPMVAIGATGEEREAAILRGGAAARLYALKKNVERFLFHHDLGAEFLALRNAITPRHVHRLFEAEGVSLSQFILERRLLEGYRQLAEAKGRSVTDIAFSLGFNDLSYFNRTFARRFKAQPREVRRLFHTFPS